ncbi:MAG: hypothetical protein KAW41_04530 [Candidatus Diapherotrites archaeon]|nr:hypothetical protein [Candidatus Diapherotrites archaeon]
MDRASAVFIAFLLMFSLLTPYTVMAQENGGEEVPVAVVIPANATGFCPIGQALEVVSLDYRQATALQGIVTQDIATSAEEYRRQAALEELGVDTRGDRAKVADKYNFYFMGPDGTVFYYEVLDDLMKPNNGYLIGTEITGRIEYGGHLRENLAMCGKTPANVTTSPCSDNADIVKRESYFDSVKAAASSPDAKAQLISVVTTLAPMEELTPADVLNIGQSRLRMTSFTTTMATSGPGSAVFVLPQALVMYTAAMKKLDMIDIALAVVAMGSIFANQGRMAKDLGMEDTGFWKKIKGMFKANNPTNEILDEAGHLRYAENIVDNSADFTRYIDEAQELIITGKDPKKIFRATENALTEAKNYKNSIKTLSSRYDDMIKSLGKNSKLSDDAIGALFHNSDDMTAFLKANGYTDEVAQEIISLRVTAGHIDEQYEAAAGLFRAKGMPSPEYGSALETLRSMTAGGEQVSGMEVRTPFMLLTEGGPPGGIPYEVGDVLTGAKWQDFVTQHNQYVKNFHPHSVKVLEPNTIGYLGTHYNRQYGGAEAADTLGSLIFGSRGLKTRSATNPAKQFVGAFKGGARAGAGRDAILGSGTLAKVSSLAMRSLGAGILLGPATKAMMIARGLHFVNDLFFRQGFFELTGSGLTLRFDKDEVGGIYSDESVVVLLAQNSLVRGLLTSYMGGELGAIFFGLLGDASGTLEPLTNKANLLGDVLLFGGIMYPPAGGVIEVVEENPSGTTHIEQKENYYIMHIREWDDHVFSAVEDVRTMEKRSDEGSIVTAMGMWTHKVDLYGHMYSQEDMPAGVFTKADPFISKIGTWGVYSNLLISSSAYYMFFSPGHMTVTGKAFSMLGMPLGAFLTAKGSMLAGREFLTSQYTSMEKLAACIAQEENRTTLEAFKEEAIEATIPVTQPLRELISEKIEPEYECGRASCEQALNDCLRNEGMSSAGMAVTGALGYAALGPVGIAAVTVVDVAMSIYKIQLRKYCLETLASCDEHTFTIVGAAQYSDPALIAEQQQSEQLKGLPGLEELPINDFLDATGLGNVTNPLQEFSQQQLNVHTEGYGASGRIAFDEVFYTHLQDVSIQWLEGNLPVNLCSLDDKGDPEEENCLKINGDSVMVGGRTIVTDELVPFKWMDTELPALVIPNTAVVVNIANAGDCTLFTVDKTGTRLLLHEDVISKFESEGFDEVARMLGTLRVINTDEGSIYPSVDYNGDFRLEHDRPDGSFGYSEEGVEVTASANVLFKSDSFGFESAVFTGGSIIKKGDKIYILPKFFMPEMSGKQWLQYTKGTPFRSDTGEALEVLDAVGNVIGLDAALARIPGGEKLGTITRLDAWKDVNGDGKVQDDEQAGWRFYTDEKNESKFEMWYNGEKEVYDADQIEIDEETGSIRVYEKDQPHVEANLLRELETKVDSLGRTLLTIRDGQGNLLLEEALVTYLKGTGGAIRYDADNNNYIFVNGQPVELNNDFKLNGFNPITGRTDPPLLQPSSARAAVSPYEEGEIEPPAVPLHEEGIGLLLYALVLAAGMYLVYYRKT